MLAVHSAGNLCVCGCYTAAVRRCCCSVDTGSVRVEDQDEKAINAVRGADSRGDSAKDGGGTKLFRLLLCCLL